MAQIGKATGIIIRKIDYSNTSVIFHLLTSTDGILHFIVRGAKKPKSQFTGKLEFFSEVLCDYIIAGKSDLHTLKECSIVNRFTSFSRNIELFYMASFMVEVIGAVPWDAGGAAEVYNLLKELFFSMDKVAERDYKTILLYFMIRFLDVLGVLPSVTDCIYSRTLLEGEVVPAFSPHSGFMNYRFSRQTKSDSRVSVIKIEVIRRLYQLFLSGDFIALQDKSIPDESIRRLNTIFMGFVREAVDRNIKTIKLIQGSGLTE